METSFFTNNLTSKQESESYHSCAFHGICIQFEILAKHQIAFGEGKGRSISSVTF